MGAPLQGRPASRRIKTSGARNSGDGSTEELHFYVCGDAERIAKDVDIVLRMVVSQHGGFSEDDADAYVNRMAQEKRYVRDVY